MIDNAPTKTAGEGKLVMSLIAGALVFYVCMVVTSYVAGWAAPPKSGNYVGGGYVGGNYMWAWLLGAGLSSAFGVEVAKRVAPNFNRIGLIVLMVTPIVLLAIVVFYAANILSDQAIVAGLSALLGTAIGLGVTFRDLMKSEPDAR